MSGLCEGEGGRGSARRREGEARNGEEEGPLVDELVSDHDLGEGRLIDVVSLKGLEAIGTGPLAVLGEAVIVHQPVLGWVGEGDPHRLQMSLRCLVTKLLGGSEIGVDLRRRQVRGER